MNSYFPIAIMFFVTGCVMQTPDSFRRVPAAEYSAAIRGAGYSTDTGPRAQMAAKPSGLNGPQAGEYAVYPSIEQVGLPYRGPLQLGQPGVTASLWRESGPNTELFRDHRAYRPMDLITIMIAEESEGKKEADTKADRSSSFLAGIASLFNAESYVERKNPGLDTSNLVSANFESTFEGKGETTRKGSLTGSISAMVVEVLPSGVMRIEGEKIIAVNDEDQVMVISGLVRPNDVNSQNEVLSTHIANLRIDYFGRGSVGDVQYVGWLGKFMEKIWPF